MKRICVITFDKASAKFVNGAKLYRKKQPLLKERDPVHSKAIRLGGKRNSTAV